MAFNNQLFLYPLLGLLGALSSCAFFTQPPQNTANCVGIDRQDFGDAPDNTPTGYTAPQPATGRFPTRLANTGARTTVGCGFWIGERVSGEAGYTDPQDPDPTHANARPRGTNVPNSETDYDDGVGYAWLVAAQSTPDRLPADLTVSVEVNSDARRELVFNLLLDANRDGDWASDSPPAVGPGEWAVRNHVISVRRGFDSYDLPPVRFPISASGMPDCMWARVTVTDQPVAASSPTAWEGTGDLGVGEVEDVLIIGANGSSCTVTQPEN